MKATPLSYSPPLFPLPSPCPIPVFITASLKDSNFLVSATVLAQTPDVVLFNKSGDS
jgi:hypothetical protein